VTGGALKISARLKNAGIENYIFEARIIAGHSEKYNISPEILEDMIKRRESREPLQYILGEWEFYGDVYKLNKNCLIPRPETEFLTEYIINNAEQNSCVLDLCSGSGCISISALKRRKDLTAILTDISGGAVEISKENAKINGVRGRTDFYCLDIIKDYGEILKIFNVGDNVGDAVLSVPQAQQIMIISNPPYLTKSEAGRVKSEKTELSHEPETALCGGDDGLDFYRFIINNYAKTLGVATVFECGINQSKNIIEMFENIGFSCGIIRDYAKIERVVAGYKNRE